MGPQLAVRTQRRHPLRQERRQRRVGQSRFERHGHQPAPRRPVGRPRQRPRPRRRQLRPLRIEDHGRQRRRRRECRRNSGYVPVVLQRTGRQPGRQQPPHHRYAGGAASRAEDPLRLVQHPTVRQPESVRHQQHRQPRRQQLSRIHAEGSRLDQVAQRR